MEQLPEDIVIVGAGIAGLATALGLHRLGLRSVVLESSDQLRASGFALATWSNAWRALDVLGAADSLRRRHIQLHEVVVASAAPGEITSQMALKAQARSVEEPEFRCLRRNLLLEALASDIPAGTIRFGSKVVLIDQEQGHLKLLHLADGSTLKTKLTGNNCNQKMEIPISSKKLCHSPSCCCCCCSCSIHPWPDIHEFLGDDRAE